MRTEVIKRAREAGIETLKFYLGYLDKRGQPITQSDLCDLLVDLMHTASIMPETKFNNALEIARMVFDSERGM